MDVSHRKVYENLEGLFCNMARPKASMVEGYLKDKYISFIMEYLQQFDTVCQQLWDANEEFGDTEEVLEGVAKPYVMSAMLWDVAH